MTGKFVAPIIYELQDNVKIESISNLDKQSAQSPTMTDCDLLKPLIPKVYAFMWQGGTSRRMPTAVNFGKRSFVNWLPG